MCSWWTADGWAGSGGQITLCFAEPCASQLQIDRSLSGYGVDLNQAASDLEVFAPPKAHFFSGDSKHPTDRETSAGRSRFQSAHNLEFRPHNRAVGHRSRFRSAGVIEEEFGYGHGSEDLTMYPIL